MDRRWIRVIALCATLVVPSLLAAQQRVTADLHGLEPVAGRHVHLGSCVGTVAETDLVLECEHALASPGELRLVDPAADPGAGVIGTHPRTASPFAVRFPLSASQRERLLTGGLSLELASHDLTQVAGTVGATLIFYEDFESGGYCSAWAAAASSDVCDGQDNDCDNLFDEDSTCSDGLACTADFCAGSLGCEADIDNDACVIEGGCWFTGEENPDNQCELCDSAQDQLDWTLADPTTSCDDGDLCSSNDLCSDGVCSGTPYVCDDAEACTVDNCDGAGGCDFQAYVCEDDGLVCTIENCDGVGGCNQTAAAGTCAVDGACYSNGDANPSNECLICKSQKPFEWSNAPGNTPCTLPGGGTGHCAGGVCKP